MTKFHRKIIICLVIIICGSVIDGHVIRNKASCFADYLKKSGNLESDYPSNTFDGSNESCVFMVDLIECIFFTSIRENIDEIDKSTDYEYCIIADLKKSRALEYLLKKEVYQSAAHLSSEEKADKVKEMEQGTVEEIEKSSLECKLKRQKEQMVKQIKKTQHSILENSKLACIATKEFSTMFNQLIDVKAVEDDNSDPVDDFCARKFVVDNNFIDNSVYILNTNPQNINTTNIDCDAIMKRLLKGIESDLKEVIEKDDDAEDKVKCIIGKYNANHYFERLLAIIFLKELNPTEAQKMKEREKFIEIMINISKNIEDC